MEGMGIIPWMQILISDIEEEMRKVKWEGVRVGERRIYRVIQ